jgi:hypothetical protein
MLSPNDLNIPMSGGAYLPARDGCKITAWEGIVHPSPLERDNGGEA